MKQRMVQWICVLLALLLLTSCAVPATSDLPPPAASTQSSSHMEIITGEVWAAETESLNQQPATPSPLMNSPTITPPHTLEYASPILNVSDQAAAMLPEFTADLAMAHTWDHYVITATLIPDELTIWGDVQVLMRNRGTVPLDALYFRLYPNHADFGGSLEVAEPVRVDGQPVPVRLEQDGVLMRLGLNQPLAPGDSTTVAMRFTARTQRNASGSAYGAFNQEGGVWSLATFYPVLARRFGNDWDLRVVQDQGDLAVTQTALYEVFLDTPPDWTLVTTGARISQQPLAHGPRREHFVSGPQRDFFLAAVRGLNQASTMVDGTRIVTYYQPDNPATGQRTLEVAAQSLRTFNDRFGRYPLAELEVIQAALTRFLGVEYPGVVLIEDNLYNRGGRTLDTTVAHEVGHQWWYSLVGNDVQGEPWLDEGLTSYMQVIYYEGQGNQASAEGELDNFRSYYLAARKSGRDGPAGGAVGSFDGNYVALVYAKGALFFHALRLHLGDELFFRSLQNYYAAYRYKEARGIDMLNQAQHTCDCDLQPLYDDWINTGRPVAIP